MALTAIKVSKGSGPIDGTTINNFRGTNFLFSKSPQHTRLRCISEGVELGQQSNRHPSTLKSRFSTKVLWHNCSKPSSFILSRGLSVICRSTGTKNTEARECVRHHSDCSDVSRAQGRHEDDEHPVIHERTNHSSKRLCEACQYVHNDAKFVNERAGNDIVLLSRSGGQLDISAYFLYYLLTWKCLLAIFIGVMNLDARACQDVAIIGSGFLKLDARARKDTKKIDRGVKDKAERLHHIACILKDKAQSKLKKVADKHWSDGALEADLRRADFFAKQRAMEDALMALEFVKNVHDMMVNKMYKLMAKLLTSFWGEVSKDRITAIQEAYWSMASALSEADGIDYTDPEELELLVATLIDLDAMDGKSSVSLLAECSSSPDVNTSSTFMWTLGNAGMGAMQRLAEDSNPAIAAAASKTIYELKKQWEIEEGDSWRFMMNQRTTVEVDIKEIDDDPSTV
ncbi:senescence-associated family protein [Actinidia rufa]|uniref:Senescence-associated family protein n=1 Tax=Actinidia rufa TaxID=165716 RepID=A0A7J0EN03_9ERIC|nr:senescence-associated family protein [Actinidia rufa]